MNPRRGRSSPGHHHAETARFGSKPGGGFNDETRDYKKNPTIDNYVGLRRANPKAEIEVAITGGIDQLFFMEPELEKHGFNPDTVAGLLDADPTAIQEICLQIMDGMIEARRRRAAGETHLVSRGEVIPEKLIDWMICCALDSLSWNDDLRIPRDLIVLIRERLGGVNRAYESAANVHEKRTKAAVVAGSLLAQGHTPTFRMLAEAFNVAPSTVKRWFPNGEFLAEARRYVSLFDEKGQPKHLTGKLRAKHRAQRPRS